MKHAWFIIGLVLALLPNMIFTLTLTSWPQRWEDHTTVGETLFQSGQVDAAVAEFKKALQLSPGYVQHVNLGMALALVGRRSEAIDEFKAAIAFKPEGIEAHVQFGDCLLESGRAEEAVNEFETALRLKPGDPAVIHKLAIAQALRSTNIPVPASTR